MHPAPVRLTGVRCRAPNWRQTAGDVWAECMSSAALGRRSARAPRTAPNMSTPMAGWNTSGHSGNQASSSAWQHNIAGEFGERVSYSHMRRIKTSTLSLNTVAT